MALLRSGEWLSIAEMDEALFAIPGIVNYSVTLKRNREIDRLEVTVFPGSLSDYQVHERIFASLLRIPVIDRAVKRGHLIVDPIRFASQNWVTSGVVKRAILQRTEEEVTQ